VVRLLQGVHAVFEGHRGRLRRARREDRRHNAKEDGREDPRTYLRGLGFAPIAVANGDAIAAAYGVQYIPGLLIVDGAGRIAYRRPWTDLPAGRTVAELWDQQVRTALNALIRS
jgi:hypothetical protein